MKVAVSDDNFGAASSKRLFKYNLLDMLPFVPEHLQEEDMARLKHLTKMTQTKKAKMLVSTDPKSQNGVILEGTVSNFYNKHFNLVKRYLVLNKHALFVYKDELAFRSYPQKPTRVIPFGEVACINQREIPAQALLKSQNNSSVRSNDMVYVMEIALKKKYNLIVASISNFPGGATSDGKNGKKSQLQPNQVDNDDQGFIFVESQRKIIMKWIKKSLEVLQTFTDEESSSMVTPAGDEDNGEVQQASFNSKGKHNQTVMP